MGIARDLQLGSEIKVWDIPSEMSNLYAMVFIQTTCLQIEAFT
jgi:hypothetical protein